MNRRRAFFRTVCGLLSMAFLPALIGCGEPVKTPIGHAAQTAEPDADRVADEIRADPVRYLESCLERCKKIDELTTTLYRQERLGIVPSLRPVERLLAKWRRSPLSIKLDMPDETSEYAQSLYIEGTHDNKLGVLPRRGLLGLPPTLGYFPVKWSVTFYKAKNLITDFGPQRMLERTLEKVHLARSEKIPGQIVAYKGVVELEVSGQLVHHIEIVNPVHPSFRHAKQDLYIDMKLQIPAGTHLWTKIDQLDAMYLYAEMNLSPSLTDEDFKIHLPKKKSKKGKSTTRPAKASEK